MPQVVLALDQGTTSTRAILFDRGARMVACAQTEHAQIYPAPGLVEHSPNEIWRNTEAVAEDALAAAGLGARDVAAIGIANQRETTLLWDARSGEPLHNALVWQDTRTADMVARLAREGGQDRLRAKTGLPLATYFSGSKLAWLLENVPGARDKAEAGEALFGTVDSWLVWRLTGGPAGGLHVTDVTNASRTQLMDIEGLDWDPALLELFRVPRACLPRIASSSEIYAEVRSGPLAGMPVAGVLGDQQAALVGQACFRPGEAKNTYGTGCFVLVNTGRNAFSSSSGLLTTVAYRFGTEPPAYALEGSIAIAGALVQWLRDNLGLIGSSAEVEALAGSVPDNAGVYFVPAFSGLYAPHWNERARGLVGGLTRFATAGHLARAALEATAYQTREVLEAMARDTGIASSELRVDGGMVVNDLVMQFQADILDAPVVRPKVSETTALGAAFAAGLAVGFWTGTDEVAGFWQADRRWRPAMDSRERERLYAGWRKALGRALDWADAET